MVKYTVHVKTGYVENHGTNSNIHIVLHDHVNQTKEDLLEKALKKGGKNEEVSSFVIDSSVDIPVVQRAEIWRENSGKTGKWYLDYIEVTNMDSKFKTLLTGVGLIEGNQHFFLEDINTRLPQDEPLKELRAYELAKMKIKYELEVKIPGIPAQVKTMPAEEAYDIVSSYLLQAKVSPQRTQALKDLAENGIHFKNLDDLKSLYQKPFSVPKSALEPRDDKAFGRLRVASVNSIVIELCTEIPEKLGVTDEMLKPLLDGQSINQAIEKKRMFIVDYKIFVGMPTMPGFVVPTPIALYYFDNEQRLMPVAIQLFQQKGPDNPVFLPTDPENTWTLAKLWFNLCDALFNQAVTHYNFTHQIMEGVAVVTKRQLSSSHPISKLINPHFIYLLQLNTTALALLTKPGGVYDQAASNGLAGQVFLMIKTLDEWRMDVHGSLPEDLKARGIYDQSVLTGAFHVRDDGLLVYDAIKKYVEKYLRLYYATEDLIVNDTELQAWGEEIVRPREQGGCGLQGIPNNGKFETIDQLVMAMSSIIYVEGPGHSVSNFAMYDLYGDPLTYPIKLYGEPPKDKSPVTKDTIFKTIGNRADMYPIMRLTSTANLKFTRSMGDYERHLISDPQALEVLEEFRQRLDEVGKIIDKRNEKRENPYIYLHPRYCPNGTSI